MTLRAVRVRLVNASAFGGRGQSEAATPFFFWTRHDDRRSLVIRKRRRRFALPAQSMKILLARVVRGIAVFLDTGNAAAFAARNHFLGQIECDIQDCFLPGIH